jgi:dihydroorotase
MMVQAGFLPDVVSSDVHALCVDGPAYDNLVTMEKLLHLGMSLNDVVKAVTATPAHWMQRPDLADLAPGTTGDAVVLRAVDEPRTLTDVLGESLTGAKRLEVRHIVLGGELWHTAG